MRLQKLPWPNGWDSMASNWLVFLAASGLADSTIGTRRVKLAAFARWCGKSPASVTREDCEAWMGRADLAVETRKGIRATLVSFFGWAADHGHILEDPAAKLPRVPGSKPKPRPCPDPDIRRAIEGLSERDALMVRLGAELALRRAEIAQVRGTDVMASPDGGWYLEVVGKGSKRRYVPLSAELADRIRSVGDAWLFPSRNDGGKSHIRPHRVGKIIGSALPDGYGTHTLRHRAATRAYVVSKDLLAVSAMLGHSSVATTQRYVAMPPEHLRGMMAELTLD